MKRYFLIMKLKLVKLHWDKPTKNFFRCRISKPLKTSFNHSNSKKQFNPIVTHLKSPKHSSSATTLRRGACCQMGTRHWTICSLSTRTALCWTNSPPIKQARPAVALSAAASQGRGGPQAPQEFHGLVGDTMNCWV